MSSRACPARGLSGLSLAKYLLVILFLLAAIAPVSGEPLAQGGFRITGGLTIRPTLKIEYPADSDLRQGLMINRVLPDSQAKGILLPGDIVKGIKESVFTDREGYYRIMSSSENSTISDPEGKASWTANRSRTILATEEASYLGKLSKFNGYSLVDRSSIDTIMEEQRLGLSGLVGDSARIGELTGTTHIMDIRISTIQDLSQPRGFLETITRRLIEVESGRVIATVVVETN